MVLSIVCQLQVVPALHLAIKSLDIKKNDEIICPSLTFIAPANMITLSGAKLVLADIDKDTLTIDPKHQKNYKENKSNIGSSPIWSFSTYG